MNRPILLCHVENNQVGRDFIKTLKKSLRNTPRGVSVRGRGPRKQHVGVKGKSHSNLRQDLPLEVSTHFAVYLRTKPTTKTVRVVRNIVDYVQVPTKWATKPAGWTGVK